MAEKETKGKTPTQEEQITALIAKTDALEASLQTSKDDAERFQGMYMQAVGTANPSPQDVIAAAASPSKPKLDLTGLPDPVTAPDEYRVAMADRLETMVADGIAAADVVRTKQAQEASDARSRDDGLWDSFNTANPDLTDPEFVPYITVAANAVLLRAQAQGLDPNTFKYRMGPRFVKEVSVEAHKVLDPILASRKTGDEVKNDAKTEADTKPAASRTEGIFAGDFTDSGAKAGTSDEDEKPGSLVEDFGAIQRESGLF